MCYKHSPIPDKLSPIPDSFPSGKNTETPGRGQNAGNVWDDRVGTRTIVFWGPELHFYCVPGFPDYSASTVK